MTSSELLPLSRATWSVLHDRHYFHHHRHRPQNSNQLTTEDELSLLTQRAIVLPVIHDLTENSNLSQHQISPWPRLKIQKTKTLNHFLRKQNIIEGENQSSGLSKTSRSSNDPGEADRFSKSVHLHQLSHCKHISVYSSETISSRKRYMCGQSSSFLWRNGSEVNKTSDLSSQVVSRTGLISIPSKPNLEVAKRY